MKDIEGYEGLYAITECGNIYSYAKPATGAATGMRKARWLKKTNHRGYEYVNLGANNVKAVHRLMAEAYLACDAVRRHVNHKNGIKNDNRIENLEWCTQEENNQHMWRTGLGTACRAISGDDIKTVRDMYAGGKTLVQIAQKYGVGSSTISRVINKVGYP